MKFHSYLLALCVAVCLIFALGSCVTTADMERLTDAQDRYQAKVDALRESAVTEEEFKRGVDSAMQERDEELEAVKEDIEDRTSGLGGILQDPIGVILGGIGSFVATNAVRNRSRRKALAVVKEDIAETDAWVEQIERKSQPGV